MAPTSVVDRYIELNALETIFTSTYALGSVFEEHINTFALSDGVNINPFTPGDGLDLSSAYAAVFPAEDEGRSDPGELLAHARSFLLVSRLLRAIKPARIEEAASYFDGLAARKLADVAEMEPTLA